MAKRGDSPIADLKVRMREALRAKVEAAAAANLVSMNTEAVVRLERSFDEEQLFSSQEMRLWAVLKAGEFHKAGVSAAANSGVDQTDKAWMNDAQSLLLASFSVMRAMIRDLVQTPGSHADDIAVMLRQLEAELKTELVHAGRAKFVEKDEDK